PKHLRLVFFLSVVFSHAFSFLCRWKSLKRHLLNMRAHSDAKGVEMKRPNESIYTFPCPDCMCRLNKTTHSKPIHTR
uniref:Uncharacterized protein n=1 Tax=Aegilops tauschii subsp. strangulata TaxID=200361 RepID=A0A452Z9N3_AEGTS